MVNIVNSSHALAEVQEVADSSENIVKDNVLGNKLISTLLDIFLDLVSVSGGFKDFSENLE